MEAIIEHLSKDKKLRQLIESLEIQESEVNQDVYLALTRSIVSQQLSVKAAATIYRRFLDLFEDKYPVKEQVIQLTIEELRQVGLSRQKANYIQNVAHFFINNKDLNWKELDDEAIIQHLTQIKGVGKWTVQMILMFNLNRLDILPLDDLAIRNRMIKLYKVTETGKQLKPKLTTIAESWKPYRTIACKYLWQWEG